MAQRKPNDRFADGIDAAETPSAKRDDGPLYARIRDEFASKINSGKLRDGAKLPTVRELAKERSINPMTVSRAYRELAERGFISSRPGSGSYVTKSGRPIASGRALTTTEPSIDPGGISSRLFELARAPGVIGFTGNYPSVELSDAGAFARCLQDLLVRGAADFFRYDPPAGREELRDALLPFLAHHSIATRADDLIVTSGGQQGMDIVARHLLSPGDRVILEQPAYFGAINVVRAAGAVPVPLRFGSNGFDLNEVADAIRKHNPRLIIINPTFQNPTGHSVPLDQRRGLVDLALSSGTPILEDDHSPEMRFRGEPLPPLRALPDGDQVVYYTRGFGKAFIPGVRLGFLLPPRSALQGCLEIKATTDLQSPALLQGALADYLQHSDWPAYVERLRGVYRERQEALVDILINKVGDYGRLALPDGGLSLWLELPGEISAREVYFNAVRRGVAFAVADSFSFRRERPSALRIAFGLTDPKDFEEGASRLAGVLRNVVSPQRLLSSAVV
jgi:DNA-binding transcriptional MocR family regulator